MPGFGTSTEAPEDIEILRVTSAAVGDIPKLHFGDQTFSLNVPQRELLAALMLDVTLSNIKGALR